MSLNNCMKKCVCFSRVSTTQQDLVQQTDEVFATAKRYGFSKEECIFIEYKESAIKLDEEERLGLNELKSCIDKYPSITHVFVYELSRISRREKIIYSIRDMLLDKNIQLVCIKPFFELIDKETGKISEMAHVVFGVFVGLAASEMMLKKERMRRGVIHAKEQGRHAGGAIMYGYKTTKDHRYILDMEKAKIVKRIFNEYVYGDKSMRILARDLQEEGYFRGIQYLTCVQEIYNILHHDCYCGRRNGMPAIITEELYDKSVAKRKSSELKVNHTSNMSLCKGILRDGTTGLLLSSNTAGKMYFSKRKSGVSVGMHIIEPIIWDVSVEIHKRYNKMSAQELTTSLNKRRLLNEQKMENLQVKIYEISQKKDKIEERLIMGRISEEKADELESQLDKELQQCRNRINEIDLDNENISLETFNIHRTGNINIDYDNMNKQERYDVVHKVIDKIILTRESRYILKCDIYNKLDDKVRHVRIDTYNKIILN